MPIKKGYRALVDEAMAEVETIPIERATSLVDDDDVVLIDLRDIRERQKLGFVPGSVHAPRGMLEFWVDPDSPYHRKVFAGPQKLVFYCQSGWRSALAAKAVQDMGLENVAHIAGGFSAWSDSAGPVRKTEDGREPR